MQPRQTPKITVAIRKRPLNKKEISKGETDIIKIENRESVIVSEYKQKVDLTKYIEETTFNFDYAFDEESTNEEIYSASIRPLIDCAFEGAKISCFAYGQTGSGKTYTMKGDINKGVPGLYYLAAKEIFNYLQHPQFQNLTISVSFYEIYCGKLYDLLNDRKQLKIREDKKANINIIGIEQKPIYSANEFLDIIEYGSTFRITSQNATNADSSRSHAIMQITLKDGKKIFSKVSFIDLAGNQRGADHMDQNKQTKIDGAQINKSLLALKQCIRALDQGKGHTPFRGSKLTMVLKDSFVGFCKTVMIGNVSPNVLASENTMNTLRYADRVKELKKGNDQSLSKEEMQAKEMMLPRAANKNTVKITIDKDDDEDDIKAKLENAKRRSSNVPEPEKMEAQIYTKEPVVLERKGSYREGSQNNNRNKPESGNAYRIHERKSPHNSRQQIKNNENAQGSMGGRKIAGSNNPLYQKNVKKLKQDQNNINTSNQSNQSQKNISGKKIPRQINTANLNYEQLNKQHFDQMNELYNEFGNFKDHHSKLVKQETIIIRDQMTKLGQMSQIDQFDQRAEEYLDMVEKSIQEKIKLMKDLQDAVRQIRGKKSNADSIARQLAQVSRNNGDLKLTYQRARQSEPMQVEFPRGQNIGQTGIHVTSNSNLHKYTYHSSSNNQPHYLHTQNARPQSYQYNYSYSVNNSQNPNGNNPGYTFSQYHQKNNYAPNYNNPISVGLNNDEQLLEDLPGDENIQKLF